MKAKLPIFAFTLLLSLTSFSQRDTNKKSVADSVLIIPYATAQLIAEDLIRYDECKEVLATSLDLLDLANEKIHKQEMIIFEAGKQYMLCQEQVAMQNEQITIYKAGLADLNKKNDSLKKQRNWLGGSAIAAILSTVLVIFIR